MQPHPRSGKKGKEKNIKKLNDPVEKSVNTNKANNESAAVRPIETKHFQLLTDSFCLLPLFVYLAAR